MLALNVCWFPSLFFFISFSIWYQKLFPYFRSDLGSWNIEFREFSITNSTRLTFFICLLLLLHNLIFFSCCYCYCCVYKVARRSIWISERKKKSGYKWMESNYNFLPLHPLPHRYRYGTEEKLFDLFHWKSLFCLLYKKPRAKDGESLMQFNLTLLRQSRSNVLVNRLLYLLCIYPGVQKCNQELLLLIVFQFRIRKINKGFQLPVNADGKANGLELYTISYAWEIFVEWFCGGSSFFRWSFWWNLSHQQQQAGKSGSQSTKWRNPLDDFLFCSRKRWFLNQNFPQSVQKSVKNYCLRFDEGSLL